MTEYWHTNLCDCASDCGSCCITMWVPCVQYGMNAEKLNNSGCCLYGTLCCCLSCCSCCFIWSQRTKVRTKYGITGGCCSDALCSWFCGSCILCQMSRELDYQLTHPKDPNNTTVYVGNGYVPPPGTQQYAPPPQQGYPAPGGMPPQQGYPAPGGMPPQQGYPAPGGMPPQQPQQGYPAPGGMPPQQPQQGYPAPGGMPPQQPQQGYPAPGGMPPSPQQDYSAPSSVLPPQQGYPTPGGMPPPPQQDYSAPSSVLPPSGPVYPPGEVPESVSEQQALISEHIDDYATIQ